MKKGQISAIEIPIIFLLLSSALIYFNFTSDLSNNIDYSLTIDSFLNSLYFSNQFRKNIMLENLSTTTIIQDWSQVDTLLNKSFSNYELIISNKTTSKYIFSCNATYNKYFSQKTIAIYNNSNFEFRKITLGVCY